MWTWLIWTLWAVSVFVSDGTVFLFLFLDMMVFQAAQMLSVPIFDFDGFSNESSFVVFNTFNLFSVVEIYLVAYLLVVFV